MFARVRYGTGILLFFALVLSGCTTGAQPDEHMVVYLVRHAEKTKASNDPALTKAGAARAHALAVAMRDNLIDHVLSSDYKRTRDTARPIADALDLEIELYDPRDLGGLVNTLQRDGGRYLVVGHSNTTPEVVRLLGGEPGAAIDEATEFDRLYVVRVLADGTVSTDLRRYGAR